MKKLTIIFGGSVTFYDAHMDIFNVVGEKTGWKFKKIAKDYFFTKINGIKVDIRFCWNPVRDKMYNEFKKFNKEKLKFVLSVPAEELVKRIKDTDAVLFIGHCGAFRGEKEDIHLPKEVRICLFKKSIVKEKDISKVKPHDLVKIDNLLIGKIKGKESRAITSNLTLSPDNVENKDKNVLIKLGKKLQGYGDVVEKESYFIAKEFKNKLLGMLMISSDVLTIKKHMMVQKTFSPSKENLANSFIKATKVMINVIK